MTTITEDLRSHSRQTHDRIDNLVMSKQPFASLDNYRKFLQAQHAFHQAVLPIYTSGAWADNFEGLENLSRFERVKSDMADLNVQPLVNAPTIPTFNDNEAIGWLYCVEGSNIGAAILYKEAGKIDLNDGFGASHLAAHPDGRKPHWLDVKAKIDALPLTEAAQAEAIKGAEDAFAYFKVLINAAYGA